MKTRTVHGPRRYDEERGCYVYDVAFKSKSSETPRTVKVAELFGIGVSDEHVHVLYDDFELHLAEEDVLYITGDSGSGKSVLLREIQKDLGEAAASMQDLPEPDEKPIIEAVGGTYTEALKLLGRVGLSDAFLFLRSYDELSEGQKYRFKLAQLIATGKDVWLCDEFCSTLDRTTARIVSNNLQKQARQSNASLIVATTHSDLSEDLNPSIQVTKGWGKEIHVQYNKSHKKQCSVQTEITVHEADKTSYKALSYLHYRGSRVTAPLKYYKMIRGSELVGVIVYTYPSIKGGSRKKAVGYTPDLKEINRNWALISRVIIHPKYRGIGLGSRLIEETLPLVGRKHVELIAVMARYSSFAEKAGMTPIKITEPHPSISKAVDNLQDLGFNPLYLGGLDQNMKVLESTDRNELFDALSCIQSGAYLRRLSRIGQAYVSKPMFKEWLYEQNDTSLAKMLQTLGVLNQAKAYLHWTK